MAFVEDDDAQTLLQEINAFLVKREKAHRYMSDTTFGERAAGSSTLIQRLQDGKRIHKDTARKVRAFMARDKKKWKE